MKPGQVSVNGMLPVSTRDREVRKFLRTEYRHLRRVVGLNPFYARGAILRPLSFALFTPATRFDADGAQS